LDWWLLNEGPYHRGVQRFVEDLNKLYRAEPGLWERDYDMDGFYWIDCTDTENSVMSFIRQSADQKSRLLVVLNLTPVLRTAYRIGLPAGGYWKEALNSDASIYGGGNHGNLGGAHAQEHGTHGHRYSALLTLAPMSAMVFKQM
jgi:1,4-alpha-glucan branching enzyme